MTLRPLLFTLILGLGLLSPARAGNMAVLLEIKGPIGPATSDYVSRGLEKAAKQGATLIILQMDTPGGLDSSMRDIIQAILASPIPVVSFVAPSGARAASAGTYISYASHVAAMAPGTNLGAATPVQIGGPGMPSPSPSQAPEKDTQDTDKNGKHALPEPTSPSAMEKKVESDARAYIRSLAQLRGRNVEWAEKAVKEAASLSAEEALSEKVIDLIADDVPDLLTKLDGREVVVQGKPRRLETSGLGVTHVKADWRNELLSVITNPNVAYILMLIGIYGLLFEFYSPGLVGPGVIGGICLLLALYAFHVLPVNYTGLALTALGVALMAAEAFLPSFGILGIGGIAAFVIGSIMLMDSDIPGFTIAWQLIGSIAFIAGALLMLVLTLLTRSRRRSVVAGPENMIDDIGPVLDWKGNEGRVRIHGEIWRARADNTIAPGQHVRVVGIDGLTLDVEPENQRR